AAPAGADARDAPGELGRHGAHGSGVGVELVHGDLLGITALHALRRRRTRMPSPVFRTTHRAGRSSAPSPRLAHTQSATRPHAARDSPTSRARLANTQSATRPSGSRVSRS